jgi:hypothetical protein
MEVVEFCLLILWATAATVDVEAVAEPQSEITSFGSRSLLLPASIFAALVVLQLLPLPPVLIRFRRSRPLRKLLGDSFPAGPSGKLLRIVVDKERPLGRGEMTQRGISYMHFCLPCYSPLQFVWR